MTAPTEYASFLDRLTEGRQLPAGCDTWGMKSVRPDGRTYRDYQWPLTPRIVKATNVDKTNTGPCPNHEGDGLCVAWNHQGMASGGIPARTLLLLAYHSRDVLGLDEEAGKCRVSKVRVVAVVDGERAIREHGHGTDLDGSDLHGSDLHGSDLSYSDLSYSDLRYSNLRYSNLSGSDLSYSDLDGSNLHGADHSTTTRWPDGWTAEQVAERTGRAAS